MSNKHHVRSSSHGRKVLPAHARPSKPPPLLKRGSSYNHAHSQSHGTPNKTKKATTEVVVQQDEEEDMPSFLNFCATCERQIVTPGASILYCSEACRKKDVSLQTPAQIPQSPLAAPPASPSYFDSHVPNIVPQRSPTILRPVSLTFSDLTISDNGSPVEPTSDQDGYTYSQGPIEKIQPGTWSGESTMARRPTLNRACTATDSSALPSLIHSPSSSLSTAASNMSQRPLPPRHNKSYSAAYSTNPIDLVTPLPATSPQNHPGPLKDASLKSSASTVTAFRVAEASDITYEKQSSSVRRPSEAQSSLKQLFRHEAMKAPPTEANQSTRLR